jgi:hypothetical protein
VGRERQHADTLSSVREMRLVAISAAYGALGGQVGLALAERLGVPFVDRAIAHQVAAQLDVSVDDAELLWGPARRGFVGRMALAFLGADAAAPVGPSPGLVTAEDLRRATEAAVLEQAATGAGVILGRGAVGMLRDDPRVLRVRLSGPRDRRLAQAVAAGDISEPDANTAMDRLDCYHAEYLKQFYGVEVDDASAYHLTIDATSLDCDACVSLIITATHALRR